MFVIGIGKFESNGYEDTAPEGVLVYGSGNDLATHIGEVPVLDEVTLALVAPERPLTDLKEGI